MLISTEAVTIVLCATVFGWGALSSAPPCRFSPAYTPSQVLKNPAEYINDLLFWEGKFHQNNVGYNATNGMTFDGTLLDPTTGKATVGHPFSAASKESLHVMVLAHALSGDAKAARFLSPRDPGLAPNIAFDIMSKKLNTYLSFNETYPGFGGFLPWYLQGGPELTPTSDWVNRVPALDNGELVWAVYAAVQVLEQSRIPEFLSLASGWQAWLDYTKTTAARVFYNGTGEVCAVTDLLDQSLQVSDPQQRYSCEGSDRIDDPYEGELFTWWLYFFGGLPQRDRHLLWVRKRPQLRSVEYNMGGIGPITVQQGFWFSSHEQWKMLQLPYADVALIKQVYYNAERVRTCNSVVNGYNGSECPPHIKDPFTNWRAKGMFASVNNVTNGTGQIIGYISDAGIPSVSNQTVFELDVITPYSVFPTALFDQGVALSWFKNMVDGNKMQNPYGSTESEQRSGKAISSFVSWDSKITTVNALLGGVSGFAREKMKQDGIYSKFISIAQREYGLKFNITDLKGEDIQLCLPTKAIPRNTGLHEYTACNT